MSITSSKRQPCEHGIIYPCNCICHSNLDVYHIMACCFPCKDCAKKKEQETYNKK